MSGVKLGDILNDHEAMSVAMYSAAQGYGWVSPNPPVGCVILDKDRKLIGLGHHERFGGDHAEISALKSVRDQSALKGSIWYVTLEPCAHQGKTPSCAKTLADLQVQKLVYGVEDPNPLVAGKGLEILRQAGIEVVQSELSKECGEIAEIFLYNMRSKNCFVALKLASSLDGQLGLKNGESQWITNEKSRKFSHLLRGQYDAVAVGANTVLFDNPKLNVRAEGYEGHTNHVVILDPEGKTLKDLSTKSMVQVRSREQVIVLVREGLKYDQKSDFRIIEIPGHPNFLWADIKKKLYQNGIFSLFVEGGALVASSLLKAKEFERIYLFYGNKILGSENGKSWTEALGSKTLTEALSLNDIKYKVLDDNFLVTGVGRHSF